MLFRSLNYSGAKELLKSPAHYQAWLKSEKEDTPALKFGRLVHLASLEPLVFDRTVRVMPECDRRTKEGKAIYEAFAATLRPDEECIKKDEMDKVLAVAESAQAGIESVASGKAGVRLVEHTFTADHEGVKIKGRPDLVLLDAGIVIDVKTTTDASAKNFAKEVFNYRYFLQAAWYLRLTGAKDFYFVAVEKSRPSPTRFTASTTRPSTSAVSSCRRRASPSANVPTSASGRLTRRRRRFCPCRSGRTPTASTPNPFPPKPTSCPYDSIRTPKIGRAHV